MMITILPSSLVIISGGFAAAGLMVVVIGLWPQPPRLKTALARWVDKTNDAQDSDQATRLAADAGRLERLAIQAFQRWHLPLSQETDRLLAIEGRSIGDFMVAKLTLALAGLLTPTFVLGLAWILGLIGSPWPVGFSLVVALAGFFWPDISLRRLAETRSQEGAEAVSCYFDLVTLLRLGNASAVQALRLAADFSEAPVFVHLRETLERAQLQQRPPWNELHRLSERLKLPELADLADIMVLDEQGAALADALKARVRELRKAHLAKAKTLAQKESEAMTIWMVVPVLVFALAFLIPPLTTMVAQ